jgi:hypothetical protein
VDISGTCAPKSDQLNAEDLLTGPRTVTIEKVTTGSAEQPVEIHLVGLPGRPFKPSKTVRRLLVAAWGADAAAYAGRRMTLYRDPSVRFGGMDVGGIRVSHLSHIEARLTLALTVTRGRRAPFVVDPLPDAPAAVSDAEVAELRQRLVDAGTADELGSVAADLRSVDLGGHRESLLSLYAERKAALGDG